MFNFDKTKQKRTPYDCIAIDDVLSKDMIKAIMEYAESLPCTDALVGSGNGSIDNSIRRSKTIWLEPNKCPEWIWKHFESVFKQINQEHFGFELTGAESFQFTIYESDYAGEYKWHIDTAVLPDNSVRKISMSILLTDQSEFEGGKLLISRDGNITVAEEKIGRAQFFPSWMQHCVTPVTKGIRKSLVIWAHGPMFK